MNKRKEAVMQFMSQLDEITNGQIWKILKEPLKINDIFKEEYPEFYLTKKEYFEIKNKIKIISEKRDKLFSDFQKKEMDDFNSKLEDYIRRLQK